MRKRRHVLQVSTFPFLAVLLCAMGSLILLLLVIDRRAKVVARAKALQAASQVEAQETKMAAAQKAELETPQSVAPCAALAAGTGSGAPGPDDPCQGRLDRPGRCGTSKPR